MAKAKPTFVQITPHIYKLDLRTYGGFFFVGVWLVKSDDGQWTVVDAGVPPHETLVMEQILIQTGGHKPRLLILTHGHYDHAAAAQRMRDEWKLPIAAGRAEIPYLLGPTHYNTIPGGSLWHRLIQISPPALLGRNVQLPLDEGMEIAGLTVHAAPGHAPGMVALLHPADRALICGDAFVSRGGKAADPLAPFTYDMALAHRAQAKLAQLDFDHLLASHGPPILNEGRAQIRALVASRETKKR